MDHDKIEQEVKRENDRKHEREESAAKRDHELKMKRLGRSGVGVTEFVWSLIGVGVFSWIAVGSTCHHIGKSGARKTDIDAMDMRRERNKCRERLDNMAARAEKGEG
jgi:hypothetical protein